MRNKTRKVLAASAVAIMLAPAVLNSLPQSVVEAQAIGTVSTTTPVYDSNGKTNGATLPSGSQWKLGQQITLNGVLHYQVGSNEYVPASVLTNITGSANSEDDSNTIGRYVSDNPDAGKTATANEALKVVDVYGNETGRVLPSGSQWIIGEILHANNMTYYQVGSNEYIPVSSVSVVGATNSSSDDYMAKDNNFGKTATTNTVAKIYDDKGNDTGVTLPEGSQWIIGNWLKYDKVGYYQVATNEWVRAMDITFNSNDTSDNASDTYIVDGSQANGKTGVLNSNAEIVNGSGVATGTTLPAGSSWKIGANTLYHDKQTYYQVATNEYVSTAYMDINTADSTDTDSTSNTTTNSSIPMPGNGLIGTTRVQQRTYNTSTNSYDMVLPVNSSWKISKLVVNKYGSYWGEVATNQWVWITDVNLNSGLDLKANSYYEPDFAVNINK